ncbi:Coactivator CBP, KIX domain-containing protein [Strongyloides ratti]|uniref:Coactivator CBP, KIX domain-containing protein n=1 Tax=Strongyloides ratti TaxID=34506 RepID=A0A090N0Y8_STRRB|nr:Coactivator CBP, KIX domain-containing protein [Strongyloides ratti]CEF71513.1 Coactivator CBP, KIX domain-containing protein [Strongyloides ratti]
MSILQNVNHIFDEYDCTKNDGTKYLKNPNSNDSKNAIEEEKNKENYYYDLAKKMLDIYDELYDGYRQSISEENKNEKSNNFNWKENFSFKLREEILNKLVKTIYPYENKDNENGLLKSLKKYLFEIEEEIFNNAESKSNYYSSLRNKIFEIQYEIRKFSLISTDNNKQKIENTNSNWKNEIKIGFRKYLMFRLIKAMYPHDIKNLESEILANLKEYTLKIENEIFEKSTSKNMYFHNMNKKEYEIRLNRCEKLLKKLKRKKRYNEGANVESKYKSHMNFEEYYHYTPIQLQDSLENAEKNLSTNENDIIISNDDENKENYKFDSDKKDSEIENKFSKLTFKHLKDINIVSFSYKAHSFNVNDNSVQEIDTESKITSEYINNEMEQAITNNLEIEQINAHNFNENSPIDNHETFVSKFVKKILITIFFESLNLIF